MKSMLTTEKFYEESKEEITITPLHIAFQIQNNKSINMILKYLSKLDYSQFNTFRVLMPKLVDYKQFMTFMQE